MKLKTQYSKKTWIQILPNTWITYKRLQLATKKKVYLATLMQMVMIQINESKDYIKNYLKHGYWHQLGNKMACNFQTE